MLVASLQLSFPNGPVHTLFTEILANIVDSCIHLLSLITWQTFQELPALIQPSIARQKCIHFIFLAPFHGTHNLKSAFPQLYIKNNWFPKTLFKSRGALYINEARPNAHKYIFKYWHLQL